MIEGVETEAVTKAKVNLLMYERKALAVRKAAFPSSRREPRICNPLPV